MPLKLNRQVGQSFVVNDTLIFIERASGGRVDIVAVGPDAVDRIEVLGVDELAALPEEVQRWIAEHHEDRKDYLRRKFGGRYDETR